MRVLIIDDSLVVRLGQAGMLVSTGIKVDAAASGEEALEKIQHNYYDVILMDINMPEGLSGIETVKEIRRQKQAKGTKIFAMTIDKSEATRAECLAVGMDGVFYKPITSETIAKLKTEEMDKSES